MISSLVNCSRGLNVDIEWGTRSEILIKEKYDSKKAALYTRPMYMELQRKIICVRSGMSMTDLREILHGAERASDLEKYFSLGLRKGPVSRP